MKPDNDDLPYPLLKDLSPYCKEGKAFCPEVGEIFCLFPLISFPFSAFLGMMAPSSLKQGNNSFPQGEKNEKEHLVLLFPRLSILFWRVFRSQTKKGLSPVRCDT